MHACMCAYMYELVCALHDNLCIRCHHTRYVEIKDKVDRYTRIRAFIHIDARTRVHAAGM